MDTASRLRNLNRIRRISRLMDSAFRIPVIGYRVGLDPILGLIPGGGDLITACISAYLVILAARFKLPSSVVGRMAFNIILESVVGTIPLVGDLFDAAFKANIRNMQMLEDHLKQNEPSLAAVDRFDLDSARRMNLRVQ